MEAIAAHAVLLIEFVGDGIHIGLGGHGLVESGIEDAHLRQTGHEFLHGIHALQVGGVVQGSQVADGLEGLKHLVGEQHALVELLAAVHHAMTHGIDFLQVLDDTNLGVSQQREDELHALGMLGDVVHDLLLLAIGQFHLDESAVEAHTLCTAAGHHALVVHIVQCILDRTTSTVKN